MMRSFSTIKSLSSWIPLHFLLLAARGAHSTFVRRASHSSTVLGDYIYVDGGQFSQIVDGNYLLSIEPHTLSIPLDMSWSPANVEINIINKTEGAPILNDPKIWTSSNAEGFYSYGGEISRLWNGAIPSRGLWHFTADGKGGGIWANQMNIAGDEYNELVPTTDGASDVLGNTAYYLGGVSSKSSNPNQGDVVGNQTPISGLVSFDMDNGVWENATAGGYAGTGKTTDGAMVHVPQYGAEGLLVVIGGTSIGAHPSVTDGENAPYVSFANISVFDPAAQTWYSQAATGIIPEDREKFCAVGVGAADNLSYEIFMYGGARITPTKNATWTTINGQLDEVFVLSIPKFEWVKANYIAKQNRYSHTCQVAGNRQMISIGGVDGTNPDIDGYNITDSFPQAIGIFDLAQMTWVDNFTHDAPPYKRPAAVEVLYSNYNPFPSNWSSPNMETLFTNTKIAQASSPLPPKPNNTSNSLQIGTILGATFGALAFISLITCILLWRRRKQKKNKKLLESKLRRFSIMHNQISKPIPIAQVYSSNYELALTMEMGMDEMRGPELGEYEMWRRSYGDESFGEGSVGEGGLRSPRSPRSTMGLMSPVSLISPMSPMSPRSPGRVLSWNREEVDDGLPRAI